MKPFFKILIASVFVLAIIFNSGCTKKTKYPIEPAITFLDFTQSPDTAYLRFSFTDGDGDIGLSQGDTSAPYVGEYNTDLHIHCFDKQPNGTYKEITLAENKYRLENITPKGKNKALSGIIKVKLQAPYTDLPKGGTFRQDFYIYDRKLHKSNVATTGDIVVQY